MCVVAIFTLVFAIMSLYVEAQSAAPAPSPTSDGNLHALFGFFDLFSLLSFIWF